MLYVSRIIGRRRYGIIDTDDDVETFVNYEELSECVLDMHIPIKGVSTQFIVSHGVQKEVIQTVRVAQDQRSTTANQAKANMLRGYDIKTLNHAIVGIGITNSEIARSMPLRLSNYGVALGDYAFSNMDFHNDGRYVFVLDDKLDFNNKSLKDWMNYGIVLDTRDITSKRLFNVICREATKFRRLIELTVNPRIIDTPQRMDCYIVYYIIGGSPNSQSEVISLPKLVSNVARANEFAAKTFRSEFKALCRANIVFQDTGRWMQTCKNFALWLDKRENRRLLSTIDDFYVLLHSGYGQVFQTLIEGTLCNSSVINRFNRYLAYFEPTEELKQAFIQLCKNTTDSLLPFAYSNGWLK